VVLLPESAEFLRIVYSVLPSHPIVNIDLRPLPRSGPLQAGQCQFKIDLMKVNEGEGIGWLAARNFPSTSLNRVETKTPSHWCPRQQGFGVLRRGAPPVTGIDQLARREGKVGTSVVVVWRHGRLAFLLDDFEARNADSQRRAGAQFADVVEQRSARRRGAGRWQDKFIDLSEKDPVVRLEEERLKSADGVRQPLVVERRRVVDRKANHPAMFSQQCFRPLPCRHFRGAHWRAIRSRRRVGKYVNIARIGDVILVVVDPRMNELWFVLDDSEYRQVAIIITVKT